ncbi:MAG: SUMF1/EgtB/PvdO family nonheme iron enzyme, partial [Candidatus Latescibacteria bacterium]|nr:SUMF1/EgtB/PvdO family nonheme iron enzyme [Candidatus Latescibacterota bacterium]
VQAEPIEAVEPEQVQAEPIEAVEPEQVQAEPIEAVEPEQVQAEPIEAVEPEQVVEAEPISAEPVVEPVSEEPSEDPQTPVEAPSLEIEPVEVTVEPSEETQPKQEDDESSELPPAVIVPPQEAQPTSPIVQQLQDSLLTATYSNSIGIEFALITPGEFIMGDDEGDDDEKPAHKVAINTPFYLGTGQITQGQWEAVMGNNPSRFKGVDNPVETVSFDDVAEFIKRLNDMEGKVQHRLPTEAEWEYACRAGDTAAFSTGDAITTDQSNFNGNHPYGDLPKGDYRQQTTPVASFPPNAYGIYDMHGNVWEWTSDFFRSYADQTDSDDDDRQAGAPRVIRGGSWHNSARSCRSAKRFIITPVYRNAILGFRLVRTID